MNEFSYDQGGNNAIDEAIVRDALGASNVMDIEVEEASQGNKSGAASVSRKRKVRRLVLLGAGVLVVIGGGAAFVAGGGTKSMSPELASLAAKPIASILAEPAAAPAAPPSAPVGDAAQQSAVVAGQASVVPPTVEPSAPSPASAGQAEKGSGQEVAQPTVQSSSPASSVSPGSLAAAVAAPAPDPGRAVAGVDPEITRMMAEQNKAIAGISRELAELRGVVAQMKEGSQKPAAKERVAATEVPAKAEVEVGQKKGASPAKQPAFTKVFSILSDGVVMMNGDVIRVGETMPKTNVRLTRVDPSTNTVSIEGVDRHVQVEER